MLFLTADQLKTTTNSH